MDKENVYKQKVTTKIPLPVKPLPALPKHLVEIKMCAKKEILHERHPLRTLNTQSQLTVAGPSKNGDISKKKTTLKIDTRHVTVRQKGDDLDWDYKVFKDDTNGKRILDECKFFVHTRQKSCGEARAAATPALKSLEPSRVKNIKRSLKRPHSRELQGLSPVAKEQKKGQEKVRRRLSFNEPLQERLMSPDYCKLIMIFLRQARWLSW